MEKGDPFAYVLAQTASAAPALTVHHDLVRRILRERDGRARRIDVAQDHGIFR
ncbi:MAG TPA: hypothetical protein VMO26_08495 [Vicinamibacterales bacterium]|nr:hypothetical protein [Vicinamibacterales bacterium]